MSSARSLPATAASLVACLVVAVGSPQAALASTPQATGVVRSAPAQHYAVPDAVSAAYERDAFRIGVIPPRPGVPGVPSSVGPDGTEVVRPVVGTIPAAGGFGGRWVAGCGACSTDHQGLDFAAAYGAPVGAATAGRVVSAGGFGGYGNQVLVEHPDGTQTRYGHLSRIDVAVGGSVRAGQVLGLVGSTGVSTGAHLHFEVIVHGTPVDPAPWLRARGVL